ncbi:butyrophilin-like protein 2 isoform X1 [Thunnus maccoyii]|uniref:butyrophilin-like protein 2 isoform X1 n=1 Tax=Thunnus maccoyii TaxID=8240 RepID=UPI001C4BFD83|nr:butyrophilin-like protein 2 isoform X1 [Thunnus maccoyii]
MIGRAVVFHALTFFGLMQPYSRGGSCLLLHPCRSAPDDPSSRRDRNNLNVVLFVSSGATSAICPTQPIEAVEGDDVTLPCKLYPPDNVSAYTVDWKRVDLNKVVYSYRHKQDHHDAQMERYRGRTTFDHGGLSRGNLTLRISSVQLNDSGPYRCSVPKLTARCVVNVSVVPKDQQNMLNRIGDATTNRPPVEDVTKPDNHDAAKERTSYAIAFPIVFFIVIVGVLVKSGMIKNCRRKLIRWRRQEGEMALNNVQKETQGTKQQKPEKYALREDH